MNRIGLALAVASLLGCSSRGARPSGTGQVNLQLLHSDCVNGRLDFFGTTQPADTISVTVTGDGIEAPIDKEVSAQAASADMTPVPYGANRVVTVVARRLGTSVAYGTSAPFELKDGEQSVKIQVLMYPMWQFAHVGDTDGQCPSILPRAGAAATLLKDGRVLITGGYTLKSGPTTFTAADLTSGTQLFDPHTGLVSNGPDMCPGGGTCGGRAFDTAITLDDGRVLVAGGFTLSPPRRKVAVDPVIFDPATDTWSAARLTSPRREFVPVLLEPDESGVRKVIAVSGRPAGITPDRGDDFDVPLTTYEIFDPTTSEWTAGGEIGGGFSGLSGYRVGELALSGVDGLGRTLSQGFAVVSGHATPVNAGEPGPFNDAFYAFDRSTGKRLAAKARITPAVLDPAVVGLNRSVLVLGGIRADDQTVSNRWYLWDGQNDPEQGTVDNGVADACTVVLDQHRSLILGGQADDSQVLLASEEITGKATVEPVPVSGTTETVVLREGRQGSSCVRINDHQVLVMGGYGQTTGGNSTLGSMEILTFD